MNLWRPRFGGCGADIKSVLCRSGCRWILIFTARGAPFARVRVEANEKSPCIARPPGIGEGMMASTYLMRQLRIGKFDGQLFDVETELREVKGQFVHIAEQPAEHHPIVSRKITPKHRSFIRVNEPPDCVTDVLARHSRPLKLRPHRFKRPLAGFGPVNLA